MVWQKHFLVFAIVAAAMPAPAMAAPWTRGYVISNYEPAFYFGGKAGYGDSKTEPGEDCPAGTMYTGDMPYKDELKVSWRTQADLDAAVDNGTEKTWLNRILKALAHRGFRPDIDTNVNPFAGADYGIVQVTGRIGEGFDLDNNSKTGFVSPDGQKGVDNALYRAWGCLLSWRDKPWTAYLSARSNDKMLEGEFTMVVRISGNQDPMNDNDATVEIGYSPDHIVKDASGKVASDYSYRIARTDEYTRLKAKIKNGVVETEQVDELHAPKPTWFSMGNGDIAMRKARLRLQIKADGNVSGLLGGYRDWRDLYNDNTFIQSGGSQEINYHQNQISMYYALRRVADGIPDPKTGRNTGVSSAYRVQAVPAFVIDPKTPATVEVLDTDKAERDGFLAVSAIVKQSILTDQVQKVDFISFVSPRIKPPVSSKGGAAKP